MIRGAVLLAAMALAPASTGSGVQVVLDGEYVGTLALLQYGSGEIVITTAGGTGGCQIDRVFADRLEQ